MGLRQVVNVRLGDVGGVGRCEFRGYGKYKFRACGEDEFGADNDDYFGACGEVYKDEFGGWCGGSEGVPGKEILYL